MKKFILQIFLISIVLSNFLFAQLASQSKINISVNVQQEIFPVIAKFISEGNKYSNIPGLVKWNIQNGNDDSVQIIITSEIPEWTEPAITTIVLSPKENKEIIQTPFGNKLLRNHSIVPTTILLKAKVGDKNIFEETKNIRVRAADDMVWSLNSPYDTEPLIAAWVTPNDNMVEKILSNAKERRFINRSLSGYQSNDVVQQVKAIFNAVRHYGVSYVSSTMSFGKVGFTQRVRLPRESILDKSANCIDGAVLFASLFENISLEPVIVLIPGHAFVGVRLAPNSRETLFIETTMVGRSSLNSILTLTKTFDAAVKEGNDEFNKAMQTNPGAVRIIDIKRARESGIYPLW
jgi:hypothetical protein